MKGRINMGFIESIAPIIQKYAPQYNIKVHSPIIAQAILESASGTSELAVNANNYFGLKYKQSVSENPPYYKIGSEQNPDGTYKSSAMQWCSFNSMESGIKGYFEFINNSRYANLIGVTDPETYLKNIKADGYATSLKYVNNVMAVIRKYDLTQYDQVSNPTNSSKKYYRVQVGAYGVKQNAENMMAKVKNAGFPCIIKQYGSLYKCQVGAFSNKANADDMLENVKKAGFNAFIVYC